MVFPNICLFYTKICSSLRSTKKECCLPVTPTNSILFLSTAAIYFSTPLSASPHLQVRIKKRCCSLHSQQHASRDITNEQQKKPAVNDRLVKCNTLKGHLKSYDICFYIIPANTDAPTTVSNPATAMARLLIAPSTGPSSMALAVPIAWADVPSPRPLAIGSSIFAIL